MTTIARREFVATIVSLAGTALPFEIGGFDADRDADAGRDADQDADAETRLNDADTQLTGVVDRIEGELAVVLLERAEETIGERLVDVNRLPADAREAGAVLSVTLADGEVERLRYDADATRRRRDAAQDRLDELAEDATEAS